MCLPLSICITRDEKVLARPGLHHHSDLVRWFYDGWAQRGYAPHAQLVGAEVNLRRKVVVLDESGLPPWYGPAHDDAVWRWVADNMLDRKRYRSWLGLELVTAWAPKSLGRTPLSHEVSVAVNGNRRQNLPYLTGPLELAESTHVVEGSTFYPRIRREKEHVERILRADPTEVRPLEEGFLEELVSEIEEEHRAPWAPAWRDGARWRTSRNLSDLREARMAE